MAFDFKNASQSELKEQYSLIAREIGDDKFFTKKELKYLPEALSAGEQVLAFTSGFMDGSTWLIVLTDRRVIFLDKGLLFGLKQSAINLDKVNSISGQTGLLFGKISIEDGANERVIDKVWKKSVKNFTNKVQEAIEARNNPKVEEDSYARIEKLAHLRANGHITDAEFENEKKRLL